MQLAKGCTKVLCKSGVLRIGRGTIIGANAVLLQSTGEDEVWVGVPARRLRALRQVVKDSEIAPRSVA